MQDHEGPDINFLLDEIKDQIQTIHPSLGLPPFTPQIWNALRDVPREAFVLPAFEYAAYFNKPLPIGFNQTISQPYIVALMSFLIEPKPDDIVLEVGTGSGYQAAVLSRMVKKVYSIELIHELATQAKDRLQRLGFDNVETTIGNGCLGWPQHAPYDAIIVTAATRTIPPALIEQLKPNGRLVMPIEDDTELQHIKLFHKDPNGNILSRTIMPVTFVPLRGNV